MNTLEEQLRQDLIRYLTTVDPLGCYSDECSSANHQEPLSIDKAVTCLIEAIFLYEHFMTVNNLI
jgi:hypothetical protein